MGEIMQKRKCSALRVAVVGAILASALIYTGAAVAQTQEPAKPAATNDQAVATAPAIKTESRLVLVDAVVTDKKGKYLRDLKQDDFKVLEDGKEQAITSFTFGTDPTSQPNG